MASGHDQGNHQLLGRMKIDPSKKYKSNRVEVTHLHRVPDGAPTEYPWRGFVDGYSRSWTEDGRYDADGMVSSKDLVEDREPREWTLVVAKDNPSYPDGFISGERCRNCNATGQWEAIRVREIIEP